MQGEHLSMADAIFAGHAHVYERLDVDGTPFFTSGISGKSFYPFSNPPLPQSRFRHNSSFGALRVTMNNTGVLCEFLTIDDGANGANGGMVIDSLPLGAYQVVCNVGRHRLDVIAGQTVQIATSLPPPAGGGVNTLNPRVEVLDPGGVLIAADDDGAADHINAQLSFMATVSGTHTLAVMPENNSSGDYRISASATPDFPVAPYEMWAAQNFGFAALPSETSADADPDADHRKNLLEYATGTDPLRADPGTDGLVRPPRLLNRVNHIDVPLAGRLKQDVIYEIQASPSLSEDDWSGIASHAAASGWTGTAPVVVSPGDGDATMLRISESLPPTAPVRRFSRMKIIELPHAPQVE